MLPRAGLHPDRPLHAQPRGLLRRRALGFHVVRRSRSTLATWLQDSGYATVYLGKYFNGYGWMPEPGETTGDSLFYVPPGWSDWRASIDKGLPADDPLEGGTYRYWDTTISQNGTGFENFAGQYQSRVYGDITEQIIATRAARNQPFFLHLSFTAPHSGGPRELDDPEPVTRDDGAVVDIVTPARPAAVRGLFDEVIQAAPGASWNDPDFSDKPAYLDAPPLNEAELEVLLAATRQRAEALLVVDRQVAKTIAALRMSGELADTLVMFTSDNGFLLGEQRARDGKRLPYNPSIRVPLLLRGPGIPEGRVRRDPFTSIDTAPTLAAVAGVTPPAPIDGRSLLGVARHGDQGWSRGILTDTAPQTVPESGEGEGERPAIRLAIGVRTQRYLYVDVITGEEELYDMRHDPQQYHNLVEDPDYTRRLQLLRAVLADLQNCEMAECRTPLPARLRS